MAGRTAKSGTRRSTGKTRRLGTALAGRISLRTRIIWGTLTAAMTVVGGLLFVADRSPATTLDGFQVPALMSTTRGSESIDDIYKTRTSLDRKRWTSIVIHHSGAPVGTLASLDAEARKMNLKGVGYHFLIGNGNGIGDGDIVVTHRWLDQAPGAHVGGRDADRYNLHSVGICMVGDGNRKNFTEAQLRSLEELVASLSRTLSVPRENIVLHRQVAPTSDPGRLFPEATFRESLMRRR